MKPSVGRTVHYVSHGTPVQEDGTQAYTSQCRAAIVTAVKAVEVPSGVALRLEEAYEVSLCVLNPTGMFFLDESVPYEQWDANEAPAGAAPAGGTWHWPEPVTD